MAAPLVVVSPRGRLGSSQLDALIESLQPLFDIQHRTRIVLDLAGVPHLGAQALALLVATLKDLADRDLVAPRSRCLSPIHRSATNYLECVDLQALLDPTRAGATDFLAHRDRATNHCHHLTATDDPLAIAHSVTRAAAETCAIAPESQQTLLFVLDEAARNVLAHANAPAGAIVALRRSTNERELEIAIADRGIGIRASLITQNPDHHTIKNDHQALQEALKPGTTATPEVKDGTGLHISHQRLQDNSATLTIRSGGAALVAGPRTRTTTDLPHLPGTIVAIHTPTDQPPNPTPTFRLQP